MFQIGDYIVKPIKGICKVEDILHLDMPGVDKKRCYYLLIPKNDKNEKIYMPTDTKDTHVRKILTEEEAKKLIEEIPQIEEMKVGNDKKREQIYSDAVKSCNPRALISIIKDLYLRKKRRERRGKKNTAVDERYFSLAESTLYSELEVSLGKGQEEIYRMICEKCEKTNFVPPSR